MKDFCQKNKIEFLTSIFNINDIKFIACHGLTNRRVNQKRYEEVESLINKSVITEKIINFFDKYAPVKLLLFLIISVLIPGRSTGNFALLKIVHE